MSNSNYLQPAQPERARARGTLTGRFRAGKNRLELVHAGMGRGTSRSGTGALGSGDLPALYRVVDSRVEAFDDSKIAELLEGAQCVFLEKGRVSIELRGPGPGVVVLVGKQARQAIKAIATPHAKR